jgi:hypothetical protein
MELKKDVYGVTILPGRYEKRYDKERFTLRIASKNLPCYECHMTIVKGYKYIRDKFWYENSFKGFTKRKTNFICLFCWTGELPKKVSGNWMNKWTSK